MPQLATACFLTPEALLLSCRWWISINFLSSFTLLRRRAVGKRNTLCVQVTSQLLQSIQFFSSRWTASKLSLVRSSTFGFIQATDFTWLLRWVPLSWLKTWLKVSSKFHGLWATDFFRASIKFTTMAVKGSLCPRKNWTRTAQFRALISTTKTSSSLKPRY